MKKNKRYKITNEQYNKQLTEYNKIKQNIEQEYIEKMADYNKELNHYNSTTEIQSNEHYELLAKLQIALEKMYNLNIIYAKYRNIIAISTMYEYIDSGRCNSLEGSNGAYNMYEHELRQNIIIDSLNQILINIYQIKNNQFALFQQLQLANQTIVDIMQNISAGVELTAYFAQVTAIAASADRYTIGVTC